jgi:hypothetical protein
LERFAIVSIVCQGVMEARALVFPKRGFPIGEAEDIEIEGEDFFCPKIKSDLDGITNENERNKEKEG